MKTPEGKFQDKVIKYLQDNKIWHFRYTASTTFGLPDIIAIINGYFVGIELKREDGKGRPSGLQEAICESIIDAGGYAGVIDSMEQLKELISSVRT